MRDFIFLIFFILSVKTYIVIVGEGRSGSGIGEGARGGYRRFSRTHLPKANVFPEVDGAQAHICHRLMVLTSLEEYKYIKKISRLS